MQSNTSIFLNSIPAAGHDHAGHDPAGHISAGHIFARGHIPTIGQHNPAGHDPAGHNSAGHISAGHISAEHIFARGHIPTIGQHNPAGHIFARGHIPTIGQHNPAGHDPVGHDPAGHNPAGYATTEHNLAGQCNPAACNSANYTLTQLFAVLAIFMLPMSAFAYSNTTHSNDAHTTASNVPPSNASTNTLKATPISVYDYVLEQLNSGADQEISFEGEHIIKSTTMNHINKVDIRRYKNSVTVSIHGLDGQIKYIHGKIVTFIQLPVLNRPLAAGSLVQPTDITHKKFPMPMPENILTSSELIIGKRTTRPLPALQALLTIDLKKPILVRRNSMVRVIYSMGRLTIEMMGQAMEDGAHGQTISIRNTQTNQTLFADVSNRGTAHILSSYTEPEPMPRHVHRGQMGTSQTGTPQMGTPQMGTPQMGTSQMGTPQMGTSQMGTPQMGTSQTGTPQMGTPQMGTSQMGTPQMGTPQMGTSQMGTPQMGTSQMGTPQMGTPQMGTQIMATNIERGYR